MLEVGDTMPRTWGGGLSTRDPCEAPATDPDALWAMDELAADDDDLPPRSKDELRDPGSGVARDLGGSGWNADHPSPSLGTYIFIGSAAAAAHPPCPITALLRGPGPCDCETSELAPEPGCWCCSASCQSSSTMLWRGES
jgi:hypothetical protein